MPSDQNMGNAMIAHHNNILPLETSPDKGNLNDTNVKQGEIPQSDPTQPYNQNLSWTDQLKAKKFLVIGVVVGVVILIIIAIVLAVLLSKVAGPSSP